MEKTVFKYIWRHSPRQQIMLTLMAAGSFPFLYLFYELPKLIINDAIQGNDESFPRHVFDYLTLDQVEYLLLLCVAFLALVLVNQSFKYIINVYKGLTGERMLRRLRFDLYARVLRFPLPTFKKMSQGEIIPMITAEVEPLGGFIGDATALPAFQGGTLLTILAFLFYQDWRMALAAVLLYPLQVWLIPKLQSKVNRLGKERVRLVRSLSNQIGETVQGVQEVHTNDTSNFVLTDFASRLNSIFGVRYQIYRKKFVIKFLNNFIQQLGPFFFYSIGGYFVINGELEIGTLIAAIAAHKDLASPWKELLTYYQKQADATIKYETVVSQFEPSGMRGEEYQLGDVDVPTQLSGEISAANLILTDDQDVPVIDGLSVKIPLDRRIAIVGAGGSGKEELTLLLARLLDPHKGKITIAGKDMGPMHEAIVGRRMSYVDAAPFMFAGTIADNLFFGLKHRPSDEIDYEGSAAESRSRYVNEAVRSGNIDFDPNADWINYSAVNIDGAAALGSRGLEILRITAMEQEVYQFGLRGTLDPQLRPDLAESILQARHRLRSRLIEDPAISELVETFDRETYNLNASVAENLIFGSTIGDTLDPERLADHPYVLKVLNDVALTDTFLSVGYQVAATMVELFSDLPSDHELFQQFSFVSAEDLPEIQSLLQRGNKDNLGQMAASDRGILLSLPFKLIPARHRLGLVDKTLQIKILEARHYFAENLPVDLQQSIEFFDEEKYNSTGNIQDNILFGKIAYGQAEAQNRVGSLISSVIEELKLKEIVTTAGLSFDVGIGGARLSAAQRQKLGIARAIMKNPDVLILCDATGALDSGTQNEIIQNLLKHFSDRCLIWAVQRASMAAYFDEVLVLRHGRVNEKGDFSSLKKNNEALKELLAGE